MTQENKTYHIGQLLVGRKNRAYYGSVVVVVSNLIFSVGNNGGYNLYWLIAKNYDGTSNDYYSSKRVCGETTTVLDSYFEEV